MIRVKSMFFAQPTSSGAAPRGSCGAKGSTNQCFTYYKNAAAQGSKKVVSHPMIVDLHQKMQHGQNLTQPLVNHINVIVV